MLEVLINFICGFFLALVGYYIIKKITNNDSKITIKAIIIMFSNSLLIVINHYLCDNSVILSFIINIITYFIIFDFTIEQAILLTGILSLYILLVDTINLIIQMTFIPLYKNQDNILYYSISNIIVVVLSLLLIRIKLVTKYLNKVFNILSKKELKLNILFIVLIIIVVNGIIYNNFINYQFNYKLLINIFIIISLLALAIIFINNRDVYNKLSKEYDVLLSSVVEFEDWIEKEQFMRHEYKNQLAVLYAMTKENAIKDKINEMLEHNIKIEDTTVKTLKEIPKGGLKGLLYYKIIIAQKCKIKLTIDISMGKKKILSSLSKEKKSELSKVIGIFFDNAIEAAKESRKKIIVLEIYELKDKLNIVISNTYKKNSIITNNERGLSSKGSNRGNGLFFAKEVVKKNPWIFTKKEIIDNYYIVTITINKNTSK